MNNIINLNLEQDKVIPRGKGRPMIIRSGGRGRPRKVYQKTLNYDEESACMGEVRVEDALNGDDTNEWKIAIKEEFEAMLNNKTWNIVTKPNNREVIGSRIILKNKYDESGKINKRKARLVIKGYSQRPGLDYNNTFAPVVRLSTVRVFLSLSVQFDMKVHQIDVNTAFLNANLEENIYMEIPEYIHESLKMIVQENNNCSYQAKQMLKTLKEDNQVCHLNKALYGLKQASRQWYKKLNSVLTSLDMVQSKYDSCLYMSKRNKQLLLVVVYVDDILISSTDESWTHEIKIKLKNYFEIKDLGKASYCLGLEIKQDNEVMTITQTKYINDMLKRFNMENCKPVKTPIEKNLQFNDN